jgi:hypothetical protein
MIIIDKMGTRYRLTKTKLKAIEGNQYWICLKELPSHLVQLWMFDRGPGDYIKVFAGDNCIGCREFSRKTFAIIMKAAREAARAKTR